MARAHDPPHARRRLRSATGDRRPGAHTTALAGSFWPRTWVPAGAVVEDRLGDEVIEGLSRRGHEVTRAGDWELGRLSCVTREPETGTLAAAANPRGAQGYAAGR